MKKLCIKTKASLALQKMIDVALLTKVGTIPAINRGGCGYVAYHIHVNLNKLGIYSQIVMMDEAGLQTDVWSFEEKQHNVQQGLKGKKKVFEYTIAASHFMVYIPIWDVYADAEGFFRMDEHMRLYVGNSILECIGEYSAEEMNFTNDYRPAWNSEFEIENVPLIKDRVTQVFEQVLKFLPYEPSAIPSCGVQWFWNGNFEMQSNAPGTTSKNVGGIMQSLQIAWQRALRKIRSST